MVLRRLVTLQQRHGLIVANCRQRTPGSNARRFSSKEKPESPPKRPISAYMWFCKENRSKATFTEAAVTATTEFGAIAQKLSHMWRKLNATEKAPFELKAEQDKVRYEREKAAYVEKHGRLPPPRSPKKNKKASRRSESMPGQADA